VAESEVAAMPCNYRDYPPDWFTNIRPSILARAEIRCEGSPDHYPGCRAENVSRHPVTRSRVVLTIAHLDHDKLNNDPSNLRALCQRCHLRHDRELHRRNRQRRRG
jgi:hypothetical protein